MDPRYPSAPSHPFDAGPSGGQPPARPMGPDAPAMWRESQAVPASPARLVCPKCHGDLVTYERKHNEANLEENRDGTDDNRSWNCGLEGETDDPEVNELRDRQTRNVLATLLLTLSLRRRAQTWGEESPELAEGAQIFRRPFSVTLLLALSLSSFFYPAVPFVMRRIVGMLLLLPALRVLPPLVSPGLRPAIYGLAAFLLSAELRQFLEPVPLFARLSCTDWEPGYWDLDQAVELSRRLGEVGVDLIDASSGGNVPNARIPLGPAYQTPFAERIRRETGLPTAAVGLITSPELAEEILANERADLIALGRALLRDPYWPLHAATALGADVPWHPQYERAKP